jgi:uncharacterized protein involved in exopolysaccharide biosynthesis
MDLKFYFALFLRRLPYFLILLAIGSAVGVTLASVLPPVYMAPAVLIVESQQIPDELAATTVQTQATEQLQIIQQRILTRSSLIDMANRLQIYAPVEGQSAAPLPADEIVEDLRRRISIVTTGGSSSRGPVQATIVTVSFKAPTAAMAAAVTNEVVTLILQENVEIRTNVAGQTLAFFVEEATRLDQELTVLGGKILEFQEANLDALPDSLEFRRSQQAAAQERLLQLEREVAVLRDRRERLVTLYETTGQVVDTAPENAPQTPEQRQLQGLRDELTNALAVLSPTNPRVKVLEAQIASLEATVSAQLAAGGQIDPSGEQLSAYDIQLADIDGQLEFLTSQRSQIEATMESLRLSIEATPGNANTLDTLQRDYANIRVQYDQAIANRARAETGDTIEALAKGQRISVIEQAIAPRAPESPNRPVIAAAGVGGGLALGLGFVALLELLNRAIRRPVDLTAKLGITPFGTLPLIRTRFEIMRRRMIIAGAFAMVLIALPAALWFVHSQITPLDLLLDQVLGRIGLASLGLASLGLNVMGGALV